MVSAEPVKGRAPYYLKVDSLDAIFFVTTDHQHREFAHLVFLKDGRESRIPVHYSFDSYSLGAPWSDRRALRIARANWPEVLIESKDVNESMMHRFNFEKGTWSFERKKNEQPTKSTP